MMLIVKAEYVNRALYSLYYDHFRANFKMLWWVKCWPIFVHFNPSNAEAPFLQGTRMQRFLKKHLNPVMLVLIGKLLLSTLR